MVVSTSVEASIVRRAHIFISSPTKNQIALKVETIVQEKEYLKWHLNNIEVEIFEDQQSRLSVFYGEGIWSQETGILLLKNKSGGCEQFPDVLYYSRRESVLKSPLGFYQSLNQEINCEL